MSHRNFLEDLPAYVSRGQRILSVLQGDGTFEIIPGRPDSPFTGSDSTNPEKVDPSIDFDPNSYSRIDKFDAVELGQELIDSELDSRPAKDDASKTPTNGHSGGVEQ